MFFIITAKLIELAVCESTKQDPTVGNWCVFWFVCVSIREVSEKMSASLKVMSIFHPVSLYPANKPNKLREYCTRASKRTREISLAIHSHTWLNLTTNWLLIKYIAFCSHFIRYSKLPHIMYVLVHTPELISKLAVLGFSPFRWYE